MIDSKSILMRLICSGFLILSASAVRAQSAGHMHGKHDGHQTKEAGPVQPMARLSIPDVEVLNQEGQKQKLYTDLVKGRIVVINFVYTSCTDVCPLSGDTFARLQSLLGDRLGKDVYLLSISTDPETDTPAKLKTWSERFRPKSGWTFVTGKKAEMQTLLMAMIGEGPRRGMHTPIAFLVNDESGAWKRTYGLEAPATLLETLDRLSSQAKQ